MENLALTAFDSLRKERSPLEALQLENRILRQEIREARKAGEITASLVVKQFEHTEKILYRFQKTNALQKAVLDSAQQISIIAANTKGIITVFNKGAENMLGYSAQEIIGRHDPMMFHLENEIALRCHRFNQESQGNVSGLGLFFAYADKERSRYYEWTYVHKEGRHIPVRMSVNALRDPYGNVEGFLCIALDVSEQKRSQKALMESERKYRLLVRNLPNVVYRGYIDGTIDFFDDKIEAMAGFKREEFSSGRMNWFDLVYKDDLQAAKKVFKAALTSEDHSYIREYRIKSRSGNIVWIEEGGQIVLGEDGEVEFVSGAFLDITERKMAEKALHESEKDYRSLFNSGPNPIFVLDRRNFTILDANPRAEDTYGYSKDQMTGLPFSELGPFEIDDIESLMAPVPDILEKQMEVCVVSQKVRHFKKNRTPFYVRITACPTHYHQQQAIIVAVTDITELVEKDAQLAQASKMTTLGQMSAGIAHELNQPLNVIKMGSEYLQMLVEKGKRLSQTELDEIANQISSQVDRAAAIISRLREFGRKPDYDKVVKVRIDINDVITMALGIIGPQLKLHNIHVVLDLDPSIPNIQGEGNRLEQVFFNLFSNAADAIKQRVDTDPENMLEQITIRTYREDKQAVVVVADTGIGIPDEHREKIFEPFFTTKEIGKGMGLGLSIVYGIVKEHGGDIRVSDGEEGGSRFELLFPLA